MYFRDKGYLFAKKKHPRWLKGVIIIPQVIINFKACRSQTGDPTAVGEVTECGWDSASRRRGQGFLKVDHTSSPLLVVRSLCEASHKHTPSTPQHPLTILKNIPLSAFRHCPSTMVAASTGSVLSFFYSFQFGDFSGGGVWLCSGPLGSVRRPGKIEIILPYFYTPLSGSSDCWEVPPRTRCPCLKSNFFLPCFPPPLSFFAKKVIFFGTSLWRLRKHEIVPCFDYWMKKILKIFLWSFWLFWFGWWCFAIFNTEHLRMCSRRFGISFKRKNIFYRNQIFFHFGFFHNCFTFDGKNHQKHVLFGVKTNCLIFCIFFSRDCHPTLQRTTK